MNPLSLILGIVGGPFGKIIGTVVGAGMLVGVGTLAIHHYETLVSDRAALEIAVKSKDAIIKQLQDGQVVLEQNNEATIARLRDLQSIQNEVTQIPSTDNIPADIRRTLERLQQRDSH